MSNKVNHPDHYRSDSGIEAIDAIEAWNLNFNLGSAIKYICRAGLKENKIQDLKKAVWFLEREIKNVEKFKESNN